MGGQAGPNLSGQVVKLSATASLNPVRYIQGLADVLTNKYSARIYEDTRVRKQQSSENKVVTLEGHSVRVRDGYVLATGTPITKNLVDSALTTLTLHAKQHVRRRWV